MRELLNRLRSLLNRGSRERELEDEIEAHLALATDELERGGLPPDEARRQARVRFGGVDAAKELERDARSFPWLEHLFQDLRYAARGVAKEPAFAAFVVLITALGIGASATVFSVLNAVLLRPLPFRSPDELVWIANKSPNESLSGKTLQVIPFLSYRERNQSFAEVAAFFQFYGVGDRKILLNGETERLTIVPVSQNFFNVLGVQPVLGRTFTADECKWNGPRAAILSHILWERLFASNPAIVGRRVTIDDEPVTVVGVLPKTFDFGSAFAPGMRADLFTPFPLTPETDRWGNTLAAVGRLKPGANVASANAEGRVLSPQITRENPRRNNLDLEMKSLRDQVSGKVRPALLVLALAVAAVMLIVCANVSNLLLARGNKRQKEIAIRAALGAGRGRLVRQILTETLLLSGLGAVLGSGIAVLGTRAMSQLTAINVPLLTRVELDGATLGFTIALALATGLVFGLLPALQAPEVNRALHDQQRTATGSRRRAWIRNGLVVSEVAFACILMVGTGLLLRSFLRVLDVELGFQPDRAAALQLDSNNKRFPNRQTYIAHYDDVLRRVRDIQGVDSAALVDTLPLGRNRTWGIAAKGVVYDRTNYPLAFVHLISDGYLTTMGVPLKGGREFTEADNASSERVIIVNETLARTLWPNENALGKIVLNGRDEIRVVGIASDVRHVALESSAGAEMYFPIRQIPERGSLELVVRSKADLGNLSAAIRTALLPIDPNLPRGEFRPLQDVVDRAVSPRRFIVFLLFGFASLALLLASLGIYAVISYSVAQRTQEIGIRVALGATPGVLQKSVVSETLAIVCAGLAAGICASAILTRGLSGLLFGVTPGDPVTFGLVLLLLTTVAIIASYLPALRASRIDPMVALRTE